MIELLIALSLTGALPQSTTLANAQFQSCVWPHRCAAVETVAQFHPCVWPNRCSSAPQQSFEVAQVQPCVWPNRCSAEATL